MDQDFMQIFYDLAEDHQKTLMATNTLLSSLTDANLEYTWKRLVKGLPSNRKNARKGFALALTEVLIKTSSLQSKDVYDFIKSHNMPQTGSSDREARDLITGLVFGIAALQRSGRLSNNELALDVVKDVFPMVFKKKNTIKDAMFKAVKDILESCSIEYHEKVISVFIDELSKGWKECSLERLAFCMYFERKIPSLVSKLLKKNWSFSHLAHPQNYDKIAVVLNSTHTEKILKSQIVEIIKCLIESNTLSSKKFSKRFFTVSDDGNNKCMVLLILEMCLSSLPDDVIQDTLNKYILNHLLSQYHGLQGKLADSLVHRLRKITSKDLLLEITEIILHQKPVTGSCLSAVLSKLVLHPADGYFDAVVQLLKKNFINPPEALSEDKHPSKTTESFRINCLAWLHNLVKTNDPKKVLDLTKFFFVCSFFDIKGASDAFPIVRAPEPELSEKTRDFAKVKFNGSLKRLMTISPGEKRGIAEDGRFWVYHLLTSSLSLLTDENFPLVNEFPLDDEWQALWGVIDEIETKEPKSRTPQEWAFELLFLNAGILVFEEYDYATTIIGDVAECFEKHRKKVKGNKWKSTFVDLLLTLLSYESNMLRNVVGESFRYLAKSLDEDALDLLMDAIESQDDEGEAIDNDNESDSDDEIDNEDEVSESIDDNELSSEDGSDESVEEEDEEGSNQMDTEQTPNDDDVDLSDADENELAEEDRVLGAAMQGLINIRKVKDVEKKEKALKKAKSEQFKVKMLDLVEIAFEEIGISNLSVKIVPRLLGIISSSSMSSGLIQSKIMLIFKLISRINAEAVTVNLKDHINSSINQIRNVVLKATNRETRALACNFLCKVSKVQASKQESPKVKRRKSTTPQRSVSIEIFLPLINNFIQEKNTKLNKQIFFQIIERLPNVRCDFLKELTSLLQTAISPYHKLQCLLLMERIYSFADVTLANQQQEVIHAISSFLAVLKDLESPCPHHIRKAMQLLQKVMLVGQKYDTNSLGNTKQLAASLKDIQLMDVAVKYSDIGHLGRKLLTTLDERKESK